MEKSNCCELKMWNKSGWGWFGEEIRACQTIKTGQVQIGLGSQLYNKRKVEQFAKLKK